MATFVRRKLSNIIKDVLQSGTQYNFFQLLRRLIHCRVKNLKLFSSSKISFPVGDIYSCSLDENDKLCVELTFMGLNGVASPLPHYFLDIIQQEDSEQNCLADFLNIFNQHFYWLLYLVWQKYHPYVDAQKYKTYTRSLGARIHNSIGLQGLISDYCPVVIKQFIPSWINLEQSSILGGEQIILGDNAVLGERAVTRSHKIIIKIGPITRQEQYKQLLDLISCYVGPLIKFDLVIQIQPPESSEMLLGIKHNKLGWCAFLGMPHEYYLLYLSHE